MNEQADIHNYMKWKCFLFKRDNSLTGNNAIKFENLIFVSAVALKLLEGAENDEKIEEIIRNMNFKEAKLTEKGKMFFAKDRVPNDRKN